MSLLHKTDVYRTSNEGADRKHPEYGFVLALICVGLALVVASVMFFDAFRPNGPTNALAGSTVDPLAMMTSAKGLPTSRYDDYSVVFN
jgi:hypothetical protein